MAPVPARPTRRRRPRDHGRRNTGISLARSLAFASRMPPGGRGGRGRGGRGLGQEPAAAAAASVVAQAPASGASAPTVAARLEAARISELERCLVDARAALDSKANECEQAMRMLRETQAAHEGTVARAIEEREQMDRTLAAEVREYNAERRAHEATKREAMDEAARANSTQERLTEVAATLRDERRKLKATERAAGDASSQLGRAQEACNAAEQRAKRLEGSHKAHAAAEQHAKRLEKSLAEEREAARRRNEMLEEKTSESAIRLDNLSKALMDSLKATKERDQMAARLAAAEKQMESLRQAQEGCTAEIRKERLALEAARCRTAEHEAEQAKLRGFNATLLAEVEQLRERAAATCTFSAAPAAALAPFTFVVAPHVVAPHVVAPAAAVGPQEEQQHEEPPVVAPDIGKIEKAEAAEEEEDTRYKEAAEDEEGEWYQWISERIDAEVDKEMDAKGFWYAVRRTQPDGLGELYYVEYNCKTQLTEPTSSPQAPSTRGRVRHRPAFGSSYLREKKLSDEEVALLREEVQLLDAWMADRGAEKLQVRDLSINRDDCDHGGWYEITGLDGRMYYQAYKVKARWTCPKDEEEEDDDVDDEEEEDKEKDDEEGGEDEESGEEMQQANPQDSDRLQITAACVRALQQCEQHPVPPQSYECPICLDTASESWPHGRRWLGLPGCGHVVCSACALTLANAGNCECPMCRQCWHLPQLEVGSRVSILYNGPGGNDEEDAPTDGKQRAHRIPSDGKGGGGGGGAPRGDPDRRASFWKKAARMLHRRCGRVEMLGDASSQRVISVRLEEPVSDKTEGTGLEVAIVGVPESHLILEDDEDSSEFLISPSMAEALAKPVAYSLEQLEALELLPSALVHCRSCNLRLPGSDFSNKQLKKEEKHERRCKACVETKRLACALVGGSSSAALKSAAVQKACWVIQGLKSRSELNGKEVRLLQAFDPNAERLPVQIDGWGEKIRVKPTNIVWADPAVQASAPLPDPAVQSKVDEPASPDPPPPGAGLAPPPYCPTALPPPPRSPSPAAPPSAAPQESASSPAPSSLTTVSHMSLGTESLSQTARSFLASGAFQLAQQVAHVALEEAAAAVGGESEKEASATQRGVSLARNVLANAADELAQQGWAVAVALNERLERRVPDVIAAANAVKAAAMDAAGAVDAQLGDAELLARASDDEKRKLEAKRAQSTGLLERATDFVRSLEREAAEQATGAQAAERAVDEAEVARERQWASDELHATHLEMQALRDENDRMAQLQAELQAERDEAIEMRDDVIEMAAQERAGADSLAEEQAQAHGSLPAAEHINQPDARSPSERLKDRLKDGHWTFCRQDGGHPVYKRTVVLEGETETCEQVFSTPSTPSDWRSNLNALSDLRARDNGVMCAMPLADGAQQASFALLNNLHRERKEIETRLRGKEEEIFMIESEWGYG